MEQLGTVLMVSKAPAAWPDALDLLSSQYYRVLTARSADEAKATLSDAHVDLVMVDDGGDGEGLSLLSDLRISHPDVVRILVVDPQYSLAQKALSAASIYQFLRKPLDAVQVGLVVKRALETRELARRHRLLSREFKFSGDSLGVDGRPGVPVHPESHRFEKLIYVSEKMAQLCDLARKAAKTEMPILIQGETGTGKELLARGIHYNSNRHTSPLMIQNCGGMPDELLQSELFGHKRGAFTGAISDRLGLFRAADNGTVFLDEISEVSPSFQVSLLRFLQEGEVKPVGSDKTETCNVRVIVASNRSLKAMAEAGKFRKDLYFRLRGSELEVPPLRDRPDDIPALAEFFAAKHSNAIGRKVLGISAGVWEKLVHFDWPGNVRELENEIRRMVALAKDGEYLTTDTLSPAILAAAPRAPRVVKGFMPEGATLKEKVESLEKQLVGEVLSRHRWNQSRAANELGLSRVGLANKIKRYGLAETS
ncbi:Fis family transcriptional regulator [Methyloceanibacter methanicus]|uniref:Fis family transcriptional regulator n=1 Tax=Methyloceanibacter methanicus TaxID=1774968 RepID=A0A1E3W1J4_9HYPH|nr:sigma-54 dependent transcriptional regulator [Methyloceanibacter methanicus]ODR99391.1 Fis family transcriptional regulator [Methyloceanibacter methanicus]